MYMRIVRAHQRNANDNADDDDADDDTDVVRHGPGHTLRTACRPQTRRFRQIVVCM